MRNKYCYWIKEKTGCQRAYQYPEEQPPSLVLNPALLKLSLGRIYPPRICKLKTITNLGISTASPWHVPSMPFNRRIEHYFLADGLLLLANG